MSDATISESKQSLKARDGHAFDCFFFSPQGPSKGGVVIIQEIFGPTDQLKAVARRYAAQGYDVALPCLFDRQERGVVIAFDDAPRGRALMQTANVDHCISDIAAAAEAVGKGRGACLIGFCWGGGLAFKAATELSLAGAVGYYGTNLRTYMEKQPKCPVLLHCGRTDEHSPPDLIAALKTMAPTVEVHEYDAGHAFANEARNTYVEAAAKQANTRTDAFLARVLGG